VKTVAHAEEFLRLSQRELHSALNTVKLDYVTTIRRLGAAAKDMRLRDASKHLDPQLQHKIREVVGTCISGPFELREVC
jgi:hypothetical protein